MLTTYKRLGSISQVFKVRGTVSQDYTTCWSEMLWSQAQSTLHVIQMLIQSQDFETLLCATGRRLQESNTVNQAAVTSSPDTAAGRKFLFYPTKHAVPSGGQKPHCRVLSKISHGPCCLQHNIFSWLCRNAYYIDHVIMQMVTNS